MEDRAASRIHRGGVEQDLAVLIDLERPLAVHPGLADLHALVTVVAPGLAHRPLRGSGDDELHRDGTAEAERIDRDLVGRGVPRILAVAETEDFRALIDDDAHGVTVFEIVVPDREHRRGAARDSEGRRGIIRVKLRDPRAGGVDEIVGRIVPVVNVGLATDVEEQAAVAIPDDRAILVIDLLAAEVAQHIAAGRHHRVADEVEHRFAPEIHAGIAIEVSQRRAVWIRVEDVIDEVARPMEQRNLRERVEHRLAAEVGPGGRRGDAIVELDLAARAGVQDRHVVAGQCARNARGVRRVADEEAVASSGDGGVDVFGPTPDDLADLLDRNQRGSDRGESNRAVVGKGDDLLVFGHGGLAVRRSDDGGKIGTGGVEEDHRERRSVDAAMDDADGIEIEPSGRAVRADDADKLRAGQSAQIIRAGKRVVALALVPGDAHRRSRRGSDIHPDGAVLACLHPDLFKLSDSRILLVDGEVFSGKVDDERRVVHPVAVAINEQRGAAGAREVGDEGLLRPRESGIERRLRNDLLGLARRDPGELDGRHAEALGELQLHRIKLASRQADVPSSLGRSMGAGVVDEHLAIDRQPGAIVEGRGEGVSPGGRNLDVSRPAGGEGVPIHPRGRRASAVIEVDRGIHPREAGAREINVVPILGEQPGATANGRRCDREDFLPFRVEVNRQGAGRVPVANNHRHAGVVGGFAAVRVEPEKRAAHALALLDAEFLETLLLDEVLLDRTVRIQHDRPDAHVPRVVQQDLAQLRQRVGRGLAGAIGEAEVLVLGIDEHARGMIDERLEGRGADGEALLLDVTVAVEADPRANLVEPVAVVNLDRVVTGATEDRNVAAGFLDEDAIIASPRHQCRLHRLQSFLHVGRRGLEGELVVARGEAEVEVLDPVKQHAEDGQRVQPDPARGLAQPLKAAIRVEQQRAAIDVTILLEDRVAETIFAVLNHPPGGARDQLPRRGWAVLVVDHHAVADVLELVAALEGQLAPDAGEVVHAVGLEDKRRRIDCHGGRLQEFGPGLEMTGFVGDLEALHPDFDDRVRQEEVPGQPAVHFDLGLVDVEVLRAEVWRAGLPLVERRADAVRKHLAGSLLHRGAQPEQVQNAVPEAKVEREGQPAEVPSLRRVHHFRRQRHLDGWRRVGERRRIKHERRRIATDVDRVVTRATRDRGLKRRTGAEHINLIRPAATIHFDRLDVAEVHDAAGARDVLVRHHEHVADRSADDHDGIDARAAVDFHGGVLEIVVAVEARAAEERGQVRDLVLIVEVLAQDEEGLEEEPVVPRAAVQVDLGAVVVHLEAVVLALAEHQQRRGVSVRHVLGVRHRHAVREFQVAIPLVRDQRHRADGDVVVAAAHVDDRQHHGVIGENPVIAGEGLHIDALHLPVGDGIARGDVDVAEGDGAGPERAHARGIKRDVVGHVGSVHDQEIHAGPGAGVVDVDADSAGAGEIDDVKLRPGLLVATVVEGQRAGPGRDGQAGVADGDDVIQVTDDHRVVAAATRHERGLEDVLQVLDNGARGIAVAAVFNALVRLIELHLRDQRAVGFVNLRRGEPRASRIGEDSPDDERVIGERQVQVERFDQCVESARIQEGVAAQPAGERVIAQPAVHGVVKGRADQHVVATFAQERQSHRVAHGVAGIRGAQRAGIDGVPALARHDEEFVTLRTDRVRQRDVVEALAVDPHVLILVRGVGRILRGQDEEVVARRTGDVQPVRGAVIKSEDVRHHLILDVRRLVPTRAHERSGVRTGGLGIPGLAVVGDRVLCLIGDGAAPRAQERETEFPGVNLFDPGPIDRETLSEVHRHRGNAGAGEVADADRIRTLAEVEVHVLQAVGGQGPGVRADVDLFGTRAAHHEHGVRAVRSGEHKEIALARAVVGVNRAPKTVGANPHHVVARAQVNGDVAADRDDIIPAIAKDRGGGAAARDGVAVVAAADVTAARSRLDDDVGAVAAVHEDDVRTVGLDVVVPRAAADGHRPDAVNDDDIIPGAAVDGHRQLHRGADQDVVVPGTGVDGQVRHVLVGVVPPVAGHLDGSPVRIAVNLVEGQGLVGQRVAVGIETDVSRITAEVARIGDQFAARVGVPTAKIRNRAAARASRQENRFGQLDVAEMESRRGPEREEQELDPEANYHLHWNRARPFHGHRGADSDGSQGEAKRIGGHAGTDGELELVVGVADAVGRVRREDVEVKGALQTEGARTEQHVGGNRDVEIAIRLQMDVAVKLQHPEHVQAGLGIQCPGAIHDDDLERRLELQDFQQDDLPVQGEQETLRRRVDPAEGLARHAGGVQLQAARRLDFDDGAIRHGADIQVQHQSGIAVVIDRGKSIRRESQRSDGEADVEFKLGLFLGNQEVHAAAALRESEELDVTGHADAQAGFHDHRGNSGRLEALGSPGRVQGEAGLGAELQSDVLAEISTQAEPEARHQTFTVHPQHALHLELADRAQTHFGKSNDLQLRGRDLDLEVALDLQRLGDAQIPAHHQLESRGDRQRLADHHQAVGDRIAREAVEPAIGVLRDLEGVHRLHRGVSVDLQQQFAVQLHMRDLVRRERQVDAADDARVRAQGDFQVQRARE